ncbi:MULTISPECIES: RNA-binding S4 domain-containing protein [unclassified Enterococcus]|uniref:RNA-binding S4 domain-containing protein n=1 Tax=unclassified Enterococcus TaxID=2608891 RepID=UPI0015560AB9|nr:MULTISPECIES: RNA-binding S4 domain-containing protein [unclassified Enterococcus]MBS7576798.1 RNA-binding S4 domain-containing protein [Enterococcus sp. MMGLQ5-2]MBS7584205.1 RNA-binding S4 domain-containing protein [Enterococcus sp. MMGLQ5-1]NPD12061.1 RNA-binding S4 domain-containing protein [Enterococcus sp. MMGLQ5-1]NPD36633.1 RNA-binding S4 domain-containing protein [Enterococcus sp. MMGLQ5-2]
MNYIIFDEFIKLGDLLKDLNIISSGGQAKYYLPENPVIVDGEPEIRRGRKIYPDMLLLIEGNTINTIKANSSQRAERKADSEEKKRIQALVKQMNQKNIVSKKQKNKPKFPGQ